MEESSKSASRMFRAVENATPVTGKSTLARAIVDGTGRGVTGAHEYVDSAQCLGHDFHSIWSERAEERDDNGG